MMNANVAIVLVSTSISSILWAGADGGSEIGKTEQNANPLRSVQSQVRDALLSGGVDKFILKQRDAVLKRQDPAAYLAYGFAGHYQLRAKLSGFRKSQLNLDPYRDIETALVEAMRRMPDFAEPIGAMYLHVLEFRSRDIRSPQRVPYETIEVTDAQGQNHVSQGFLIVSDAPKEARLYELLQQMMKIAPDDPLVLFCRGHAEKDPVKAIEYLKRSIELCLNALYEFDAYYWIKRKAQLAGDAETEQWVTERVVEARKTAPPDLVKLAGF